MHAIVARAALNEPQAWADVAAYLSKLPAAQFPETADGEGVELGEAIFHEQCASCHEEDARGDDDGFAPSLRDQHYSYLVRQTRGLGASHRLSVDADLVRFIDSLDTDEITAVADYLSQLRGPVGIEQSCATTANYAIERARLMNPINNILVIVDPTAELHPAVAKAALLARRLNARLELYVCDTKASREVRLATHAGKRLDQPMQVNLKAFVEDLAKPIREHGLDVATEVECADPLPLHAALIDRARRTTADLIVKDTHHHSLGKRTFMTNTDWELIRACQVPLLLTKPNLWASAPRVCAAVDPGHANDKPAVLDNRIVDYAALLAKRLGGELHLLHVYLPTAIVAAATAGSPPMVMTVSAEDLACEADQKRALLQHLVAEYRVAPSNVHLEVGGPAAVLPRAAGELRADIMAMGAISRSGFRRVFIGSTAEDVLEGLPCDAFIVRPPNFADDLPF
jgi:universal stress protein E